VLGPTGKILHPVANEEWREKMMAKDFPEGNPSF
jgi:hypothetical protein